MENNYWKTAEIMNGRLAMIGLLAAVVNYGLTGWIIPGIAQSYSKKNGKYTAIEAIYCWRSQRDFNRFMRFANRYAKQNGLAYEANNGK